MVRKRFPETVKTGTIAPFFIMALVPGNLPCGHLRDVALQRCDKLPHQCPERPATLLAVIMPLC